MTFTPKQTLPDTQQEYTGILDRKLATDMRERVSRPFLIDTTVFKERVIIDVQLPDGVLSVIVPGDRLFSSTTYIFIFWMVGTSLILLTIAIIFLRNQIRPIRRLAAAVDRFGKGESLGEEFQVSGATEVRQAGAAFNRMRERISRQIRQRTDMLSGVSHDLRTPLTRMRLQLAMLTDEAALEELKADVLEMEKMIDGYLTFARGEGDEPISVTDLNTLIEGSVAGWQRNGTKIDCHIEGEIALPVKADALRRCIDNLISNAVRYGHNVWVSAGKRNRVGRDHRRRRRTRHPRRPAPGRVSSLQAAGRITQPGDRRHRIGTCDRARHRARSRRGYRPSGLSARRTSRPYLSSHLNRHHRTLRVPKEPQIFFCFACARSQRPAASVFSTSPC